MNPVLGAVGLAIVLALFLVFRKRNPAGGKPLSFEAQFDRFLRRKAVSLILMGLISNTVLAQLYVRTNGKIIFPGAWSSGYVIASAIGTTLAFSLFEVLQTRTLNELMNDGLHHGKGEWAKNLAATAFASAYNFYSIALLDYALSTERLAHHPPTDLPDFGQVPLGIYFTAAGFTAILFLVSFVGDRKLTPEQEVKRVQDETQRQLLASVQVFLPAIFDGTMPPSREFVALCTMGSDISKRFFANFVAAMTGKIDMEDLLAAGNVDGIIQPRANKNTGAFKPPEKQDDDEDNGQGNGNGKGRTPEEMDALRVRMLTEGYPLQGLPKSLSDQIRRS